MKKIIVIFSLFLIQFSLFSNSSSLFGDTLRNYPCNNNNTFWTINTHGDIQEWQLNHGFVSGGQIILSNNGFSLSYCGTETSQTFYTLHQYGFSFFNSPNWVIVTDSSLNYGNSGGFKQFQYYQIGSQNLFYYNGSNFSLIFNGNFQVADVSVDTIGRAWVITEDFFSNGFLNVIDSSGTVLKTYTDSSIFNLENAYGSFFLNDTLYIGFGHTNPLYGGKIVPILLNGSTFNFGTPINFPDTNAYFFADMASCYGNNKAITNTSIKNKTEEIKLYPNPSNGLFNLSINQFDNRKKSSIEVYNLIGECVHSQIATSSNCQIDLSSLANGIYNLSVISNEGVINKRLIIAK